MQTVKLIALVSAAFWGANAYKYTLTLK